MVAFLWEKKGTFVLELEMIWVSLLLLLTKKRKICNNWNQGSGLVLSLLLIAGLCHLTFLILSAIEVPCQICGNILPYRNN